MARVLAGKTWICVWMVATVACSDTADGDAPGAGTEAGTSVDTSDGMTSSSTDETGATTADVDGVAGCGNAILREVPSNPSERGPWPVGARTAVIDGLTVEAWYPAVPGSEAGVNAKVYDIRDFLPESERDKISDADNPAQPCDCYADLPVDDVYGPYPVIVFVHGTAGFRTQSLHHMEHWASRGFVVLAADHPGLMLGDLLGSICGTNAPPQQLTANVRTVLEAASGQAPGLEWLAPHVDASRIGLAGHSAGGRTVGMLPDIGHVIVPMASGGVGTGSAVESVLVLGGTADSVVAYDQQIGGFESSPSPKRLVGLDDAGHLAFSDICSLENDAGEDLITIAVDNEVCGAQFATVLFQCSDTLLPDPDGWAISRWATSAAFEETLHCRDIGTAFADLSDALSGVAEVRESL